MNMNMDIRMCIQYSSTIMGVLQKLYILETYKVTACSIQKQKDRSVRGLHD